MCILVGIYVLARPLRVVFERVFLVNECVVLYARRCKVEVNKGREMEEEDGMSKSFLFPS